MAELKLVSDTNVLIAIDQVFRDANDGLLDIYKSIETIRQNVSKIKDGKRSFTANQICLLCSKYGINANFIYGLETNIYRVGHEPKTG